MRAVDNFVLGLATVSQLACGAQQVSGERRDADHVEANANAGRRAPERDLKSVELAPEVAASAALAATAVEKCLQAHGGRIALELSDTEAYIAESIRPSGERPEVGIRVGQYFMCNDANQKCGVAYAMPNQFYDDFGPKLDRWGLEAKRFRDVSPYTGAMQGADGVAEMAFDFNLPPQGGHEAICMPMPDRGATAFVDRRPANPRLKAHTDLFGCKPAETPNLARAHFQEVYRGILVKLAKGCAEAKVSVPGSKYVKPDFSGARGLGSIDTGAGTGKR